MASPLQIAVVGHANAGKTSLLRTLTRRSGFGEVSDRPGTTRHVEAVDLQVDGRPAVRFYDTPGLEDPVGLLEALGPLHAGITPPQRIRAFLKTPQASDGFEQEAKVLRCLLDVDAALYVVDCREPVVAKFRCEVEILASCGVPVLPVLNHVRGEGRREAQWQGLLADFALHACVRFDAVAPYAGAEQRLYRSLQAVLPQRADALAQVERYLAAEQQQRRDASWRVIADALVDLTAARVTLARAERADAGLRAGVVKAFRASVTGRAARAVHELLDVHAFSRDEADLAVLPWLDGRWEQDVFDPEVLRDAGVKLTQGAAVGASIGLAADVALAGLSLGTGTAIGAAIGGAASQGFATAGRRAANLALGRTDLTLEDSVVLVIACRLVSLVALLEERGHAATRRVLVEDGVDAELAQALKPVLKALRPARAHPEWGGSASRGREAAAQKVAAALGAGGAAFLPDPASHAAR